MRCGTPLQFFVEWEATTSRFTYSSVVETNS